MTSEKIIVLVCDRGDGKHGEITVLDDPRKAERLVETLLEAGFEEERIRVFSGRTSEFQINHRPVVALVDEQGGGVRQPAAEGESRGVEREEPGADAPVVEEPVTAANAMRSSAQEETAAEVKGEGQSSGAETAAPVRFSSLFRSA